jgi:glycosyltransferase involved in cell wall biosynthesis
MQPGRVAGTKGAVLKGKLGRALVRWPMAQNAKIKVAVLITRMDLGGAQQVALETACRLSRKAYDVSLLAGAGGELEAEAQARLASSFKALPYLKHPISLLDDLWAVLKLTAYLYGSKTQILHTHSSKAGLLGRVAAALSGVPVVVHTVHGWSFNDTQSAFLRRGYAFLERLLAYGTDALVVVAESCRQKGQLQDIGHAAQYHLIRAAADIRPWQQAVSKRSAGRELLGIPEGVPVVGTLANLKPQKDPLTFVRTAAHVIKAWKPGQGACPVFVYLGDGPLKAQAQALAKALGIEAQLRFMGWVKDPQNYMAGYDVFLLSSAFEGLPCVFPQAMALQLPVVATHVDGAPELVKEGVTGFLCLRQDAESLADRILLLLADPLMRKEMGQAGAASLGPEWSYDDMVKKTEALYASLTCGSEF